MVVLDMNDENLKDLSVNSIEEFEEKKKKKTNWEEVRELINEIREMEGEKVRIRIEEEGEREKLLTSLLKRSLQDV